MDDVGFSMLELYGRGYCCSQIMFILVLNMQGRENPDVVRSMAGLCHGIGFSQNACGVLSGGVCLLSYYAAKGADFEEPKDDFPILLTDFVSWFKDEISAAYGGINCADILKKSPDRSACQEILLSAYSQALRLLTDYGYDPAGYEK